MSDKTNDGLKDWTELKPAPDAMQPDPGDWAKRPAIRVDDPLVLMDTETKPAIGTEAPCLLCTKMFEARPSIGDADQVCEECYKTYDDCAVILCEKCNRVQSRLKPGPQTDGYIVQKRQLLHLYDCPACCAGNAVLSPEGYEIHLIREIDEWHKHVRDKKIIVPVSGRTASQVLRVTPPTRIK